MSSIYQMTIFDFIKEKSRNKPSLENGLNVLSLFDGISCGQLALQRAGIKVNNYFASEIEKDSVRVTQHNFPKTIQLGDVRNVTSDSLPVIDLIIGGSPCQDISSLNIGGKGLEGVKSGLFFEYLRLIKELKPSFFLLENVSGKKQATQEITNLMGVEPLVIDSRLITAQKRKRLYWTNISVTLLEDKEVELKDILEPVADESYFLKDGRLNWFTSESGQKSLRKRFSSLDPVKAQCLTARGEPSWNCNYVTDKGRIRKLTPIEWERLQTVPDNYTACISDNKRYEALGNGWTVDVVAHIFKGLGK